MRELFLFVRPPRPTLPLDEPSSALWPPLAFACLAASLRNEVPELAVDILDASALEMGWKSLETELRRRRPAFIGVGEEAVACVEVFRLARLAHTLNAQVIAGGAFFSHVAPEALSTGLIDVVVHGEGEQTLVDLARVLPHGVNDALLDVAGLSFRQGTQTLATPNRPLIECLDDLPLPAYDLLPVGRYGARSRDYPHHASIELGRGCLLNCEHCLPWRQMARPEGNQRIPQLRTKSSERLTEEVRILMERYDRRYLHWVDPCFNADPEIPGQLAEHLLHANLRIGQSAWTRAPFLIRDAASGALEACVRSGLDEVYVPLERSTPGTPASARATRGEADAKAALEILRRDHPQVFVFGVFLYGFPEDTPATILDLHRLAIDLEPDVALFIPVQPFPGTPGWRPELWDATGRAFRQFHQLPESPGNRHRLELEDTLDRLALFDWPVRRLQKCARQLACPHPRRRALWVRRVGRAAAFHARNLFRKASLGPVEAPLVILPGWYER